MIGNVIIVFQAAESPSTSLNLDNDTNNYSSSDELQRALELSRETALLEGHVEDDDLQWYIEINCINIIIHG